MHFLSAFRRERASDTHTNDEFCVLQDQLNAALIRFESGRQE